MLIWEIGSKGALLTSRTSRLVPETTTQIHDTSFSSRYMIYYDQGGRAYFWRWEEKGPAGSSLWDLDLYDKHALPVTN